MNDGICLRNVSWNVFNNIGHCCSIETKKGTREMSFTIYQADGRKCIQYFFNIDELIKAMIKNPNDRYHRND